MIEQSNYLSSIFGKGALQLHTTEDALFTLGAYAPQESVFPLTDVSVGSDNNLRLTVTQEHCAGHFTGPTTLPGYRMLELGGMLGEGKQIQQISNAVFKKIVTPTDEVIASRKKIDGFTLTRNEAIVASADVAYSDDGLTPHQMGLLLEISAQTIVANIIKQKGPMAELYFPLIRSVGAITVLEPAFTGDLVVTPSELSRLDKRDKFLGSTVVQNGEGQTVARIDDIDFLFANAGSIELFTRFGKSSQ